MELGLEGKVAIVGGASKGLGRAVAMELAKEGVRVTIAARNEDRLQQVAEEIKKLGGEVLPVKADFNMPGDIRMVVDKTSEKFGDVDILVTNTGGPPAGNFFDISDKQWMSTFNLTFMHVVRFIRHVVPHMQSKGWGRIINLTSMTVKQPKDMLILSNSIRAAVIGLAKSLSFELAKYNITVNNIAQGVFETDRIVELTEKRAEKAGISYEEALKEWTSNIPLGRMGNPEELAALVAFLASERAGFITGATIQIDGGEIKFLL